MKIEKNIFILILWLDAIALIGISLLDFTTWSEGINTYPMYLIFGFLMIYILLKSNANKQIIWGVPIIGTTYYLTEFFNFLYFPLFPATKIEFFMFYFLIFSSSIITSLIFIKNKKIPLNLKNLYFIIAAAFFIVITIYVVFVIS